jgi:hypothetical protein
MRHALHNDVLTMCELSCYICKVPRVILAFLYAVVFDGVRFCLMYTANSSRAAKIYVFEVSKMPSLKRPVRTSTRWEAMQGGADETECLPSLGLAPPSTALVRPYLSSARSMRGGSMAGPPPSRP